MGIWIVALLLALPGGLLDLTAVVMTVFEPHGWSELLRVRSAGFLVTIGFMVNIGAAASLGLIFSRSWAWHLATFYLLLVVYSSVRSWVIHGLDITVVQGVVVALHILSLTYLQRSRVLRHHQIERRSATCSALFGIPGAVLFYHALTWAAVFADLPFRKS